jgi:hypothetical protein
MNLPDALKELEGLLHRGTLTQEEFELAKRKVLESGPTAESHRELEELKLQVELHQLEFGWNSTRESCMMSGKGGGLYVPTLPGAISFGIFMSGIGLVFICMSFYGPRIKGQPENLVPFQVMGVFLILFALGYGSRMFSKARRYHAEHQLYLMRRKAILERQMSALAELLGDTQVSVAETATFGTSEMENFDRK